MTKHLIRLADQLAFVARTGGKIDYIDYYGSEYCRNPRAKVVVSWPSGVQAAVWVKLPKCKPHGFGY